MAEIEFAGNPFDNLVLVRLLVLKLEDRQDASSLALLFRTKTEQIILHADSGASDM